MIIDLSKGKNSDEWHFLHSPEMYYQIYEEENPDPEKIALEAYRKG